METIWVIGGVIVFLICKASGRSLIASGAIALIWPLFVILILGLAIFQTILAMVASAKN